jgi:hypothetical protein
MKHKIFEGFAVEKLYDRYLNYHEAMVLRWLITKQMAEENKKITDRTEHFPFLKFKYTEICREFPLLHIRQIGREDGAYNRKINKILKSLEDAQVINAINFKGSKGTHVYIGVDIEACKDLE